MLNPKPRIVALVAAAIGVSTLPAFAGDQPCFMKHLTGLPGAVYGHLGYSLVMRENMALVSEFGQNQVYVYQRIGPAWQVTDVLTGITGFGTAMGLAGDRAVFTSWGYNAATVCEWDGAKWLQTAVLEPDPIPAFFTSYGYSAAIDGDTIAIGAPNDDPKGAYSGSVFVYRFNGIDWVQEARLSASDGAPGDELGRSVAIVGDRIVAGAMFAWAPLYSSGAVYVFDRESGGAWIETAKIACPKPENFGYFGQVMCVVDDELWVSSVIADTSKVNSGAVFRLKQDELGYWKSISVLGPTNSVGASPAFGTSIARHGNLALIGAIGDQQNGGGSGASFVFERDSNGAWKQIAKLTAPTYGPQDWFGSAVAIAGQFAVVGAHQDEPFGSQSGSAYIFAVGPDGNGNGVMDPCECPGDLNKDWMVDQADLGLLLTSWGCKGPPNDPSKSACPGATTGCCGDLDADGDVDQADLGIMLQNFGNVCP